MDHNGIGAGSNVPASFNVIMSAFGDREAPDQSNCWAVRLAGHQCTLKRAEVATESLEKHRVVLLERGIERPKA